MDELERDPRDNENRENTNEEVRPTTKHSNEPMMAERLRLMTDSEVLQTIAEERRMFMTPQQRLRMKVAMADRK